MMHCYLQHSVLTMKNIREIFIILKGAVRWNGLSVKTRNINKYDTFKSTKKKWIKLTILI